MDDPKQTAMMVDRNKLLQRRDTEKTLPCSFSSRDESLISAEDSSSNSCTGKGPPLQQNPALPNAGINDDDELLRNQVGMLQQQVQSLQQMFESMKHDFQKQLSQQSAQQEQAVQHLQEQLNEAKRSKGSSQPGVVSAKPRVPRSENQEEEEEEEGVQPNETCPPTYIRRRENTMQDSSEKSSSLVTTEGLPMVPMIDTSEVSQVTNATAMKDTSISMHDSSEMSLGLSGVFEFKIYSPPPPPQRRRHSIEVEMLSAQRVTTHCPAGNSNTNNGEPAAAAIRREGVAGSPPREKAARRSSCGKLGDMPVRSSPPSERAARRSSCGMFGDMPVRSNHTTNTQDGTEKRGGVLPQGTVRRRSMFGAMSSPMSITNSSTNSPANSTDGTKKTSGGGLPQRTVGRRRNSVMGAVVGTNTNPPAAGGTKRSGLPQRTGRRNSVCGATLPPRTGAIGANKTNPPDGGATPTAATPIAVRKWWEEVRLSTEDEAEK